MSQYRAIRGMVDILPDDTPLWQMLEQTASDVLGAHGYQEIRTPIVESTDLFARSIGEVTDIVEKEMYSFPDRNDESLSLRPEGTASTVRAMVQHNLIQSPQRVWYRGPMFRYERPQKGRQRQFHQLGVEAFGVATPDLDAELLLMCRQWWKRLGIDDVLTLELNTIGSGEARQQYKAALTDYLRGHFDALDDDSQRRLDTNPLRILDSKSESTQLVLKDAPAMSTFLMMSRVSTTIDCANYSALRVSRLSLTLIWFGVSTTTTKPSLSGRPINWVRKQRFVAVDVTTPW